LPGESGNSKGFCFNIILVPILNDHINLKKCRPNLPEVSSKIKFLDLMKLIDFKKKYQVVKKVLGFVCTAP